MSLTPKTFLAARGATAGMVNHLLKRQATVDGVTPTCITNLKCDYISNLSWNCEEGDSSCVLFCDAFASGDYMRESIKCVETACADEADSEIYVSQMAGVVGELSGLCTASIAAKQKRAEEGKEPSESTSPAPTAVNEWIPSTTSAICHEEPIPGEYDPKNPSLGAINPDCACIVNANGTSTGGPRDPSEFEGAGVSIRMGGVKGTVVAAVLFGSLFSGLLI